MVCYQVSIEVVQWISCWEVMKCMCALVHECIKIFAFLCGFVSCLSVIASATTEATERRGREAFMNLKTKRLRFTQLKFPGFLCVLCVLCGEKFFNALLAYA